MYNTYIYERGGIMIIQKRTASPDNVRKENFIPGVIYGKGIESEPVQVEYKDFIDSYREFGKGKTFTIELNKEKHIVYINDTQMCNTNQKKFSHFDLLKVSAKDTIESLVPITFVGKEELYKAKLILTTILNKLEVEYNVGSGISSLEVDVSELTVDNWLYVKDIKVPKGVRVLADLEDLVAKVSLPSLEEATDETDETADANAEVESIKQTAE